MVLGWQNITLATVFSVLLVANIVLNFLVFLAVHKTLYLKTPMNYLIANLALCDILIGLFIFPRHVIDKAFSHPGGEVGNYLCKLLTGGGFLWTSVTASGFFFTAIAVERYVGVVYPDSTRLRIKNRGVKKLAVLLWIFAFTFNCPSSLSMRYDETNDFCLESWPDWFSPKVYVTAVFLSGTSSVFFIHVLFRVRTRITVMLALMAIVLTICRTPNYVFYLMTYFNADFVYGSYVYKLTVILILANSLSHPLLILWQMRTIRRAVSKIFKGMRTCCG
ncbi:neuromedin-U receptor 2 [Exaiptasia diaphana]|uniref:G-protein coupled receptors family 1 profile domain-containing protein n=1 Tax=Exaiptasia diaphana TaxID=2652724 RepID=A0A913WPJ4_EXADI|nr:neuromedin-U receptor 2 [Exaiptasia diaphana]